MNKRIATIVLLLAVALGPCAIAQRQFRPGFNLFTKDQDIQLGAEVAAKVQNNSRIVHDAELSAYVQRIGERLAATPEANGYPYTFTVVANRTINAFALPGGPTFVNTGLIGSADNEAQIAGVMAHEIAHVVLRHGTSQVSKAKMAQIPSLLSRAAAMRNPSMTTYMTQLGVGFGTKSLLLSFSRASETEADLLGAQIMASAGYDPGELAHFFQKLKSPTGTRAQFFSNHPDPEARERAIQREISHMPRQAFTKGDPQEFARMKQLARAVPIPKTTRTANNTQRRQY